MLTISFTVVLAIQIHLCPRQIVAVLALLVPRLAVGCPAASTVRQWLLRLGLAALRRAVRSVSGGWTLIVDTLLGRGTRECLVVLGIPTQELRQRTDHRLARSDVTVLALEVFHGCDGAKVHGVLKDLLPRLGKVTQIVCDQGTDLWAALRPLLREHPEIVASCDIRHLCAALLRGRLKNCSRFQAFVGACGAAAHRVRLTAGNFLAPPALRDKARFMNWETHVEWALGLLDERSAAAKKTLAQALGVTAAAAADWFAERFGWLAEFAADVGVWAGMLAAAAAAQEEVQQHGLSRQTAGRFWQRWRQGRRPENFAVERFAEQIREALERQGQGLARGQVGLGSSDVIESLFGQYKELMSRGPDREVTANVVQMALMTGAPPSNGEIAACLAEVSTAELEEWQEEQFGPSDRARRRAWIGPRRSKKSEPDWVPKPA